MPANAKSEAQGPIGDREIVTTHVINAPRDLVWKAWTTPAHLSNWWGPNGFTTTTSRMEFKPGGVWRYVMHGPDGQDYQNRMTYLEIVPRERLVIMLDEGEDNEQTAFHSTITFQDQGQKTLITMRAVFPTKEERDRVIKEHGAIEGGQQTLARLANYAETEIIS